MPPHEKRRPHGEAGTALKKSAGRQDTRSLPATDDPYLLAALLDPYSLVLHDTASFDCPRCRRRRACTPTGYGFRCGRCDLRGTTAWLAWLVRRDPDAARRHGELVGGAA